MIRRITGGLMAAVLGLSLLPGASAQAQTERDYILATATTGGTYYPVGVALATLIKVKLQPKQKIGMSAITSAGSGDNIKLLRDKQAQFAIVQGLYGQWAWTGTGKVTAKQPHLRSVSMLWQNVEHFVINADHAGTGTIDDLQTLKGMKFSIGKKNSGSEGSGLTILGNLGYDAENHFDLVHAGYGPSADLLQNGNIDGMNTPAGPPVGAVTKAFAALGDGIRVLDFTDAQMAKANGDGSLWTRYVIASGTYPGQTDPIKTIAQPNFLAVHADVDDDAVYQITRTIYENLPFLNGIHPATKAMKLDVAMAGLPVPLHPGAQRYFEEAGISVPATLKAD